MTNLNKGRFKSADEAQAVWCFFALQYREASEIIEAFKKDKNTNVVGWFDDCADNLHRAHLIHGSIYDEHGRIEDKDVAQAEYDAALFDTNIFEPKPICKHGDDPQIYNNFIFFGQNSTAVGTIFY